MEAKFLEAEVVQIIQLRRRQRLFSTMFDGWRRASIKAWEGAAGAGQTPMPEMTHDSMDVGDDESTVAHDNDSHDGGDGDGDSSRGEGSDKEGPSDESTHGAADDTTVVQRTPRQPERRRRSKGGRMGVDGSPMTDSKLQSLEQRMWYQFNEKQRHLKAGHAHRMAKLEQLFQLKKKQAVELALANYRDELQQDTKQAVESMRKREAELFEKEAEEFRASLQSDIDYVQKMASEFELKAERALSSRRQRMVEERRTAVQRLYKQQQAEIAAARERMKVLLQSDMMERSSAKLKTAIAIESERLEEEAESRISELRAQCDAELVRIRSTKPEELWRESTRGQKLAQRHQELLDQLDSERRAWKAELKDLELNQLQQETLTQRLIGQEKLRHVAELETVRQRFRQTTRSLSDGSFVDKMNSAVFRLLEHTDKLSRPRRSKADSRNNSPSTGNPKQVARAELHSPTVTLKGRSSRTSTPSPSKESEDARVSPSWLRIYGGIDDNRRR